MSILKDIQREIISRRREVLKNKEEIKGFVLTIMVSLDSYYIIKEDKDYLNLVSRDKDGTMRIGPHRIVPYKNLPVDYRIIVR